ncbi:dihydroneopterin aldolase [Stygiobacter electus]|uniref:7,8-dihydroneopterin aldolase n=1 Tax=Stygiobacter electus TaxID=3032292 RepID=A0AAE3NXK7_9BACT|nr:dihydroneopterin aldolase [Stygiobacter electus]MDF1610587.1 dihydroneopterin aldolase [Stygiobacter electus]
MINVIKIKNAVFYAYHGAMQEEQSIGGKFEIDIDMYTDFTQAAKDDSLKETIDYDKVYKFVSKIVHAKKYKLIETLAMYLAEQILNEYKSVTKIAVRVRKHSVPVGGVLDFVEAEVIRENGK